MTSPINRDIDDVNLIEKEKENYLKFRYELRKSKDKRKIERFLGRGVFGACFTFRECGENSSVEFVVKYYFLPLLDQHDPEKSVFSDSLFDSNEFFYHKNIVSVLDCKLEENLGERDLERRSRSLEKFVGDRVGRGFLVMRSAGETLEQYLKKRTSSTINPGLNSLEFCRVMIGILEGACYLHDKDICHRDLHMGNLFIQHDEINEFTRVRIGDFGMSINCGMRRNRVENKFWFKKGRDDEDIKKIMSYPYFSKYKIGVGGKLDYLPPEVIAFKNEETKEVDYSKCDVYSVGMVGKTILRKYMSNTTFDTALDGIEFRKVLRALVSLMTLKDMKERFSLSRALGHFKGVRDCLEARIRSQKPMRPFEIQVVNPQVSPLKGMIPCNIFFSVDKYERIKQYMKTDNFNFRHVFYFGNAVVEKRDYQNVRRVEDWRYPHEKRLKRRVDRSDLVAVVSVPKGEKVGHVVVSLKDNVKEETVAEYEGKFTYKDDKLFDP